MDINDFAKSEDKDQWQTALEDVAEMLAFFKNTLVKQGFSTETAEMIVFEMYSSTPKRE
jgi:hypothetical protein